MQWSLNAETEHLKLVSDYILDGIYTQGFAVAPDFVAQADIAYLQSFFDADGFKKAGIGKGEKHYVVDAIRGDYIRWLQTDTLKYPTTLFFDQLAYLTHLFNRRFFLGINYSEFHLAYYPKEARYHKHTDTFIGNNQRKISVVVYLNDFWELGMGGELLIYNSTDILTKEAPVCTVYPKAGTVVFFESTMVHEVLPSLFTRKSLTGWLASK